MTPRCCYSHGGPLTKELRVTILQTPDSMTLTSPSIIDGDTKIGMNTFICQVKIKLSDHISNRLVAAMELAGQSLNPSLPGLLVVSLSQETLVSWLSLKILVFYKTRESKSFKQQSLMSLAAWMERMLNVPIPYSTHPQHMSRYLMTQGV